MRILHDQAEADDSYTNGRHESEFRLKRSRPVHHPLMPVAVTLWMNQRSKMMNTSSAGSVIIAA